MFATIRQFSKLVKGCDDPNWDCEINVNYNLDDEAAMDVNEKNYIDASLGNYTNIWSTAFDIDSSMG